ncbi:MAG: acylphosphatase [Candidatus Bathyarchaeia archaeon]
MEAYILKVFGRVQRVGFRRYALDSAQELGLAGYVKNQPDGSIEIFVQGEREGLARFLDMMGHPPPPALVKEIRKEETDVKPEVKEFRIVYGELIEELQEGFGAMQSIFTDYWGEFRDYREEFRDFRGEFRDFRQEFKDFRQEFKDYREEFRDFAQRTDDNFKLISEKYGEISEKLTIILETLIRESKETKEMLNETMKSLKEALERLPKASS